MKRTTQILCFGLLIILTTSLISGTWTNNLKENCLKDCLNQKITADKICLVNFNKDLKECSKQYDDCLIDSKSSNLRWFLNIKFCKEKYTVCKNEALNLKDACNKNTLQDYEKCVKNCKNQECTSEYSPVCGKLNVVCFVTPCTETKKTFNNLCELEKQGAIFLYKGECKENLCNSNNDCKEKEFCEFESCSSETGKCISLPDICPTLYAPVCSCNEKTYSNDCVRKLAKVSKAYEGECKSQDYSSVYK